MRAVLGVVQHHELATGGRQGVGQSLRLGPRFAGRNPDDLDPRLQCLRIERGQRLVIVGFADQPYLEFTARPFDATQRNEQFRYDRCLPMQRNQHGVDRQVGLGRPDETLEAQRARETDGASRRTTQDRKKNENAA